MQTVYIICESHIPSDGRVLRFAQTLRESGYRPIGFGYDRNDRSPPPQPNVPLESIEASGPIASPLRLKLMALSMISARFWSVTAFWAYWLMPERRRLWAAIKDYMRLENNPPDIIIAKHWTALPIAIKLAKQSGAKLVYDIVEISHAEHEENWKWRLVVRPFIKRIERCGFKRADALLTIGNAAAIEIKFYNGLESNPVSIRNVPDYFNAPLRSTSQQMVFLYHGLASPDRCLEALIESVKDWRKDLKLVLRLTGKPSYLESLKEHAKQCGVISRIEFSDPVPQKDVVKAASDADIGLCLFPGNSRQKRLAEPNKLHQYVMGGLAILSSDLPNLSALIDRHGYGMVVSTLSPEAIAKAVNSMTIEAVNQMRKKSRAAAKELCWENEQKILLKVLANLPQIK